MDLTDQRNGLLSILYFIHIYIDTSTLKLYYLQSQMMLPFTAQYIQSFGRSFYLKQLRRCKHLATSYAQVAVRYNSTKDFALAWHI